MRISLEGLPVLVEVFWKSGVALGAALCISGLLRKKSADMRRLVISAAIVAMFAAAAAMPLLPRLNALTPVWFGFASPAAPIPYAQPAETSVPVGGIRIFTPAPALTPQRRSPVETPAGAGAIPALWLVGSLLLLVRLINGLRRLRRLRMASEAVSDTNLLACLDTSRGVSLLENEAIAAPVTWGVVRPVILLPTGFGQLPSESRDAVLCHELGHIQSCDFFMRALAETARALIWFQPLMWIALRQLREEQELACDDRVLAAGGRPSAYAKMLLDWNVRPGMDSLIAVGITHRGNLKRRVHALLDQDLRRDRVARAGALTIWSLGLAVTLPLAALSFSHAIPAPHTTPNVWIAPVPEAAMTPAAPALRVQLAQARPVPAPQSAPVDVSPLPLPKFSTRVILVLLDETVKDKNGKTIEGLGASDFAVTEDGVEQTIRVFDYQKLDSEPPSLPPGMPPGLSSYYILGYYSTNFNSDGAYRKTNVRLKNDATAKLDYRSGYYANRPGLAINGSGGLFMVDGVTCQSCDNAVGPGITFPVLVSQVQPEYAEEARRAKYSGTVTLNIDVDASGQVASVTLVKRLGMGLDEKAIEAVKQWKFKPGMQDGKAVAVKAQVEVLFSLL